MRVARNCAPLLYADFTCSWHVNYVDYVAPRKSWEHRRIKGGAQRANLKIFRLSGEGKKASGFVTPQHSTKRNKLCNQQICPYKPSHDYEYTGTQICHKSPLREMLRTPARLCKQRTRRTVRRGCRVPKRYRRILYLVKTRQYAVPSDRQTVAEHKEAGYARCIPRDHSPLS